MPPMLPLLPTAAATAPEGVEKMVDSCLWCWLLLLAAARLDDVVAHCENKVTIDFPIIADETREIAVKYGECGCSSSSSFSSSSRQSSSRDSKMQGWVVAVAVALHSCMPARLAATASSALPA